jgi:hypothetical protein
MRAPVWCGESASVFKGSYHGRTVAVKVLQLYSSNREVTLRVSPLVTLYVLPAFLIHDPEILQRGSDLETPLASQYPPFDWYHHLSRTVFDGFGLDGKWDDQSVC